MKQSIVILSSVFAAVLVLASTAQAQQNTDKLSKQQLSALIANAKTPVEHERIAQYYSAKAQDDLAQAKEHEQMAQQFKSNSVTSSSKYAAGTVNHCEYLAQQLGQNAAAMQKLQQQHEQMAAEAGQK